MLDVVIVVIIIIIIIITCKGSFKVLLHLNIHLLLLRRIAVLTDFITNHNYYLFNMNILVLFIYTFYFTGDYIGIIRDCYKIGSLPMKDESDKCHEIPSEDNTTSFLLCLCSQDFCNTASRTSVCSVTQVVIPVIISLCLVIQTLQSRA